MSYDLSFDRKSSIALLACMLFLCGLIGVAGFLIGVRHTRIAAASIERTIPAVILTHDEAPAAKSAVSVPTTDPTVAPSKTEASPSSTQTVDESPKPTSVPSYVLQFGVFKEKENAEALMKTLKSESIEAEISVQHRVTGGMIYVVRGGSYATIQAASDAAHSIREHTKAMVLIRRGSAL